MLRTVHEVTDVPYKDNHVMKSVTRVEIIEYNRLIDAKEWNNCSTLVHLCGCTGNSGYQRDCSQRELERLTNSNK